MRGQASERTGAAIRKLRLAKGWTLVELGAASGLPVSTLSRLELGHNALNNDKLIRLCRALDVDVSGFVAHEADKTPIPSGRRAVIRAGDGSPVRIGHAEGRRGGDDLLDKAFTPIVLEVAASSLSSHGPLTTMPGEAYAHVLEGSAVLHSELYAPIRLDRGDAIYFDGRMPHAFVSADSAGARVLLIQAGDQTD